jgi:phosphoglycolate phosphatase-like HAD superfamily hydrolase
VLQNNSGLLPTESDFRHLSMHLVVFDINGTLTDTCQVEHQCYWRVICDVFGIGAGQPDWSTFRHITDSGIAQESCERYLGRAVTAGEIDAVRQQLTKLLEVALPIKTPAAYQIPGASMVLGWLRKSHDFAIALVTGGFEALAELKLRRAGLFDGSIPLASCDDAVSREQIMRIARDRAAAQYAVEFTEFTHVGDGTWDVEAARRLDWNFIGIGIGTQAERLRRAGARVILPNFEPLSRFVSVLHVPKRPE